LISILISGGFTVIAPFWTDIDLSRTNGVVYLGHISRSSEWENVPPQAAEVYEAVELLIVTSVGDIGFLPTEVVTVTWRDVSPIIGVLNAQQVRRLTDVFLYRRHYVVRPAAPICISRVHNPSIYDFYSTEQ